MTMNVPVELQIWSADRCAEYLEISKTHFLNCIRYAQGFPAQLPIPTYTAGGKERQMDPRWSAAAVIAWALCRQEITQESRTPQKAA